MNYNEVLEDIKKEVETLYGQGKVATYIPALANTNPKQFGMSVVLLNGDSYHIGDVDKKFSIQSISKVFSFTLALKIYGKELYKKVGHEPSGNPFNSLVQLEYENGIPRNPFINAGAIAVADSLVSYYKSSNKAFENILNLIKQTSCNNNIVVDEDVYNSELESGFRNYALVNLMKSFKNIDNSVESVMNTYFRQCSIEMTTKELSRAMLFLANHGADPITKQQYINESKAKRVNSLMLTCGHYDASGDFAFHVGLPGKSGVGGGIVAIVPYQMAICVYSPELNNKGNSLIGTKALELFTTKTGLSVF